MRTSTLKTVLDQLRLQVGKDALKDVSDTDLLERFRGQREEAAFTLLVQRHGPMVLGVCRRVLGDAHAAEDAFQKTFLVLVRKADSLRKPQSLASWLYGVAYRTAAKTRSQAVERHTHERATIVPRPVPDALEALSYAELYAVLDEEIGRLADKHRRPLVLCCLEGRTYEQAAQEMAWPKSTVAARLKRACELLRQQLTRRGITLPAGAVAALLTEQTAARAVPALLILSTVRVAAQTLAGQATAALPIVTFFSGMVKGMTTTKLGAALTLLLTVGLALAGVGVLASPKEEPKEETLPRKARRAEPPRPQPVEAVWTDHYGDPLPPGAVARLGTVRFRHEGTARELTFSPNGKILVGDTVGSGSIVWDATTGKELHRLPERCATLSPDGAIVAALSGLHKGDAGKIILRELPSGKKLREFDLPDSANHLFRTTLCFAPDGKSLAVFNRNQTCNVAVLELASGKVQVSFKSNPQAFAFSPDSKTLALGDVDPSLRLWDIATGKMIRGFEGPKGHFATAAAFSPDGKTLAWATWDLITLSDVSTGKELTRLKATMEVVTGLAFTPDGKTLVSGSQDGKVRIWDVSAGKTRFLLDGRMSIIRSMALSADGKTVAVGTYGQSVQLWNVTTGKELFTELQGHDWQIDWLAFSPDGKTLVSGDGDQQIRLWDTAGWQYNRLFPGKARTLSFSPDGKRLASAFYKKMRIWDVATSQDRLVIPVPDTNPGGSAIMFSADGRQLFTFDRKEHQNKQWESFRLGCWDATTGKQESLWTLPQTKSLLTPLLSQDAKTIVAADENLIHLFDVKSRRDKVLQGHEEGWVESFALSFDGRVLASGGRGKNATVRLWETVTGKEMFILKGHDGSVSALAWSPHGRVVASGEKHEYPDEQKVVRTIRLWDAASGTELARFDGYNADVKCLAFSPDGAYLGAGLADSTILIWETGKRTPKVVSQTMSREELEARWIDLAGEDAAKAQQACWKLIETPQQSVPFLRERLKPATVVEAGQIQKWIAELSNDEFAVREAATKELEKLGGQAEAPIKKALRGELPLETRRRLELISNTLPDVNDTNALRTVRAIMVLEKIGSSEARKTLERLADGSTDARQTREAKASLQRLKAKQE